MIKVIDTGYTKKGNPYVDVKFNDVNYRYILNRLLPSIIKFYMDDIAQMNQSQQGTAYKNLVDKIKKDATHYCKSGGEWKENK